MKTIIRYVLSCLCMGTVAVLISCQRFLEVSTPPNTLTVGVVFSSYETANSAVSAIYRDMVALQACFSSGGLASITNLGSLAADDLSHTGAILESLEVGQNAIMPDNGFVTTVWATTYKTIYQCNSVVEGLDKSESIDVGARHHLAGEALFVRAFCYFYLVNLFADVPLILSTDYRLNRLAPRSDAASVYGQIVADLIESRERLPKDYGISGGERIRANYYGATALLARVYLYLGEWQLAKDLSTEIIVTENLYGLLADLDRVFLKNSGEAIWQLMPVEPSIGVWEAYAALSFGGNLPPLFVLTDKLRNAFPANDRRFESWVNNTTIQGVTYHYPYKYKIGFMAYGAPKEEYSMVLRLSEQYLIRAESCLMLGDTDGSLADLNTLRAVHGGLDELDNSSESSLMEVIEQERQVEFFYEWGHRWFDLKRWQRADSELSPLKPQWEPTAIWWPVPEQELTNNPYLRPQNQGY